MRDYPGAAGIVHQDVEPALGFADRVRESFDRARILCVSAAGAVTGTGQTRNQSVGGLGIIPESDDDTRPGFREQASSRSPQAFAAARNQRHLSVEHAHAG
jgi:hypothetical protein